MIILPVILHELPAAFELKRDNRGVQPKGIEVAVAIQFADRRQNLLKRWCVPLQVYEHALIPDTSAHWYKAVFCRIQLAERSLCRSPNIGRCSQLSVEPVGPVMVGALQFTELLFRLAQHHGSAVSANIVERSDLTLLVAQEYDRQPSNHQRDGVSRFGGLVCVCDACPGPGKQPFLFQTKKTQRSYWRRRADSTHYRSAGRPLRSPPHRVCPQEWWSPRHSRRHAAYSVCSNLQT